MDKKFLEKEYLRIHRDHPVMWGSSTVKQKDNIKKYINEIGAVTILDYGCGKGLQYEEPYKLQDYWGVPTPYLYDPYVAGLEEKPDVWNQYFDLVLCIDVMEHILKEDEDEVLAELFTYGKHVIFNIDINPAIKTFKDGSNLHVNLKSGEEWERKIREHAVSDNRFELLITE